jgi:hypothetical protein
MSMVVPTLLDQALLDRFDARLRAAGALVVDHWAPGLTDAQIDALLHPLDIDLPDEARVWWRWHNGTLVDPRKREAKISPGRHPLPLKEVADFYAGEQGPLIDFYGVGGQLRPVSEKPLIYFDCAGRHDEPVPIITALDASDEHRVVLPSIGELILAWIDLLDRGIWATNPDGTWIIDHDRRLPPDVLNLAIY